MTPSLKRGLIALGGMSLAPRPVFARATGPLTVFNYHEVTDTPSPFSVEHGLNVTPSQFGQHLDWIRRHYEVVGIDALLANRLPVRAAMVTFDDGFASTFEVALPLLHARRMPSIVFVNGAVVQGDLLWAALVAWVYRHEPGLRRLLDERQRGRPLPPQVLLHPSDLRAFVQADPPPAFHEQVIAYTGRFGTAASLREAASYGAALGNHLDNHYNAASLTPVELTAAYARNRDWLRQFPHYRDVFSYPFGQPGTCYTAQTHVTLREAGAQRLFGAWALPNRDPRAFLIHRCTLSDRVNSLAAFRFEAAVRPHLNGMHRQQPASGVS